MHVGPKFHALGLHLLQPPINDPLFHLEIGDTIAQQPADAVRLLKNGHAMARARELLSSREACGPGPHDRDGLAGSRSLQHGLDPALVESFVNDVPLDDPDRHRIRVDAEDTGRLTRRRAEASLRASFHRPRWTRSFHSGIRLTTGQPLWL